LIQNIRPNAAQGDAGPVYIGKEFA
jgi:hypothetical protein